ncbi:MAG: cell division protein FtsL [Clostridia bacterium]|nr:cell division protein FtsL [Clostridia bacterium]
MNQAGKNYVYGSTAEKLQYDVYEENKVLKAKKIHRSNSKEKAKMVWTILVVFAMCLAVMYRYAMITEMNYNVYKQSKVYNDLRNENSNIKVQIEKQLDLNNIREIAEKKLGMQKPDKHQRIYVKVPKYDYTKVADNYRNGKSEATDNMFGLLVDKVGQFSKLLY